MNWLEKLPGKRTWKNHTQVPEPLVNHLAGDFLPLEKYDTSLPVQVLHYVLDGEGEDVLGTLAGLTGAGRLMQVSCVQRYDLGEGEEIIPRYEFFRDATQLEPALLVRLAKSYEAVSRRDSRMLWRSFEKPELDWLEVIIIESTRASVSRMPAKRPCVAMSAGTLEKMLILEGHPADTLVRALLFDSPSRLMTMITWLSLLLNGGLAGSFGAHSQVVIEALNQPDPRRRAFVLKRLQEAKAPPHALAGQLAELMVGTGKTLRAPAEDYFFAEAPELAMEHAKRLAASGGKNQRPLAAAIVERQTKRARALAKLGADTKQSRDVSELVEAAEPDLAAVDLPTSPLPPLAAVNPNAPLGPEVLKELEACFSAVRGMAEPKANAPSPAKVERAFALLQTHVLSAEETAPRGPKSHEALPTQPLAFQDYNDRTWAPIRHFLQRLELLPIHCVRLLYLLNEINPRDGLDHAIRWHGESLLNLYFKSHPSISYRELGAAMTAVGIDSQLLGIRRLRVNRWLPMCWNWEAGQTWPYFTEHLDLVEESLKTTQGLWAKDERRNALEVLATFPTPPARLAPLLWELALGPKSERALAQAALERAADKVPRLIAALTGGSPESRAAAADWLARIKDPAATEPLLAALGKEKNEAAKGAFMSALEALGAPVEKFVSRSRLAKEAAKGLAKGVPPDLAWFPFDQMPSVHWADNSRSVGAEVLKWLLVQSCKLKSPEPGPLLRRYCALFRPTEREAFGQFVLTAWLAEDTAAIAPAEAEKQAMAQAAQSAQWAVQYPQWFAQKTQQQFYEELLPQLLRTCKGSAIASKGVLAVAAACCGNGAAPVVGRYLKDWYGQRAAQCRALVQALAWMDHPTATQLMLAVGGRFRTKSIQEEATKQAQALAERKGWTLDELADRTVPSAGFDEQGELRLDYGPRQFTARMGADFSVTLLNPDGKEISALPDPRQGDDEALAEQARKSLSAAKKELKSVLQQQRDRLYEAMCTQRAWRFEDWELFLNRHPVLRHYCQRLVWAAVRAGKPLLLFRPLPDGTLTDAQDEPLTLGAEDRIHLVHASLMSAEAVKAWAQHLADYEVEPLFNQLAAAGFTLPEERKTETELTDFLGHVLESFRLRGRATKLGYTRGQTEDGGWFYGYRKRFATLGIEAVIEFTGNSLPEENRKVALQRLAFERAAPAGGGGFGANRMPLGEVPAVLLCECWHDLSALAAEGSGFDPNWEKSCQP